MPHALRTRMAILALLVTSLLATLLGGCARSSRVVVIPTPAPTPTLERPAPAPSPSLERLEVVATDVTTGFADYWGQHKSRIIRLSNGDVYLVYNAQDGNYHVMKRSSSTGTWTLVYQGRAGLEPTNIVRGAHDAIHVFPYVNGKFSDVVSTDGGTSFSTTILPGTWDGGQGYAGVDANAQGTIVAAQTGDDVPGQFYLAVYNPAMGTWTYAKQQIPYRYTYGFYLLGSNNDLSIVAVRDVLQSEIGCSAHGHTFVFDTARVFHLANAFTPSGELSQTLLAQEPCTPSTTGEDVNIIVFPIDAYLDTLGRLHVLYVDEADGGLHHAILQGGVVVKDVNVQDDVLDNYKARLIQDTAGRFYLISMSGNALRVVPTANGDTDGTRLGTPVDLSLGSHSLEGTGSFRIAAPRTGTALADYVDGHYQSNGSIVYFRVRLNANG